MLAYASWRLVEIPFRKRQSISRAQVFGLSAFIGIAILVAGTLGSSGGNGFLHSQDWNKRAEVSRDRFGFNFGLNTACDAFGAPSEICTTTHAPEILLWGDSNAMHLALGIMASSERSKLAQATFSGCGPILDIAPIDPRFDDVWSRKCIQSNDAVMEFVRRTPSLKYVILSSAFGQYVSEDAKIITRGGRIEFGSPIALDHFTRTIEILKQANVLPIVVSPAPQTGNNIGHCLSRAFLYETSFDRCDFSLAVVEKHQARILRFLHEVKERNVQVVFLSEKLCEGGRCRASIGEIPLYRDQGHFSREGSEALGREIDLIRLFQAP